MSGTVTLPGSNSVTVAEESSDDSDENGDETSPKQGVLSMLRTLSGHDDAPSSASEKSSQKKEIKENEEKEEEPEDDVLAALLAGADGGIGVDLMTPRGEESDGEEGGEGERGLKIDTGKMTTGGAQEVDPNLWKMMGNNSETPTNALQDGAPLSNASTVLDSPDVSPVGVKVLGLELGLDTKSTTTTSAACLIQPCNACNSSLSAPAPMIRTPV